MRRLIAASALTAALAGCSAPEDAGAPPPTAEEEQAVGEARSMIPEAEQAAAATEAPANPSGTRPPLEAAPEVTPTLKPGYGTPVPPPERAE